MFHALQLLQCSQLQERWTMWKRKKIAKRKDKFYPRKLKRTWVTHGNMEIQKLGDGLQRSTPITTLKKDCQRFEGEISERIWQSNKVRNFIALPSKMSDELTTQVKCILHNPGVSGRAVTRKTAIAIVNGVLKARCPEMLEENERKITLTTKWTRGVLKSLDRIKRRDTTGKREMNPALYELIFSCKRKIANAIFEHRIQKEMILNFDQTARGFTSRNKSTFTRKGVHSVPTENVDDKRQITATYSYFLR